MEPLQEKSPLHPKNTLRKDLPPILILLAVTFLLFGSLFVVPQLDSCPSTDRIATPETALAFGKNYIRKSKNYWETLNAASAEELESILSNGTCCGVTRGDYFLDKPEYWRVYISGKRDRLHDHFYEIFFSECKRDLHVEGIPDVSEPDHAPK